MISISCLESKLLNNNNWYGRFQLAPFQKGEGLTVANALRRTLLAEKSNFFITWVDFYNAEIPYSVLTGMRESIFDILLNLKQVIFTSDKILPNNSHFFKMPLNNNFRVQKKKSHVGLVHDSKPTWTNKFTNKLVWSNLEPNLNFFKKHDLYIAPNSINNRVKHVNQDLIIDKKINHQISKRFTNSLFSIYKQKDVLRSSRNQYIKMVLPMTQKNQINKTRKLPNLTSQAPPVTPLQILFVTNKTKYAKQWGKRWWGIEVPCLKNLVGPRSNRVLNPSINEISAHAAAFFVYNPPSVPKNGSLKDPKHGCVRNLNSLNYIGLKTQNIVCQNQILGKILNSKDETCLLPLKIFGKDNGLTNQFLDTSTSKKIGDSSSRVGRRRVQKHGRVPCLYSQTRNAYIGYICAKGPTTIYAKNIKLPKGLKCVDPNKYIATLADDGLFYLRFALTSEIKTLSLNSTSDLSININQGLNCNMVQLKTFPKILLNKEIQSCFRPSFFRSSKQPCFKGIPWPDLLYTRTHSWSRQRSINKEYLFRKPTKNLKHGHGKIDPFILNQKRKSKKSNQSYFSNTKGQSPTIFYPIASHILFSPNEVLKQKRTPFRPLPGIKGQADFYPKNLINKQRLLLTNDSIKQFNFQNTSITANIQKTCLLNIQIKHYYYKCGRFDRFLFDLIKPFKPSLKSTYYNKPSFKENLFGQRGSARDNNDWKVLTYFHRTFERQKANSQIFINYKRNNLVGSRLRTHLLTTLVNQSGETNKFHPPSVPKKRALKQRYPNIFKNYESKNTYFNSSFGSPVYNELKREPTVKWQKIFKSIRTGSIYDYLQKLYTSEATRIYFLLTRLNFESDISLLSSKVISTIGFQSERLFLRNPRLKFFQRGPTRLLDLLKSNRFNRDAFDLGYKWLGENADKQESTRFKVYDERKQNNLWMFRLHESYIEKFLNICLSFQCSKNNILYFFKSYIVQYNNESNLLNKNLIKQNNTLPYPLFKPSSTYTEKLLTRIKILRQWSSLPTEPNKDTKISLLKKKTYLFPLINSSFLIRQIQLLELLCLNQNNRSRYDNYLREFFHSKTGWLVNKKIGFLSTSNKSRSLKDSPFQQVETGGNNSIQISTNLRAKPFISIRHISYKPVCIFTCQFQALPVVPLLAKPWSGKWWGTIDKLWSRFYNINSRCLKQALTNKNSFLKAPKQTVRRPTNPFFLPKETIKTVFNPITNNSVVLKPIYLNVEQIIYILKQTTQFRKNQRINPVFFNSLTSLKKNNHYPLNYSLIFSKVLARNEQRYFGFSSLEKPYWFNNVVNTYVGTLWRGGTHLLKFYINRRATSPLMRSSPTEKTIGSYFINQKTRMFKKNTRKRVPCHVWVLGNDFVFKKYFSYTTLKSQTNLQLESRFNLNTTYLLQSIIESGLELNMNYKSKPKNLYKEPYNINICHSKISFNLRYTYPFKYTIFETFLPFKTVVDYTFSLPGHREKPFESSKSNAALHSPITHNRRASFSSVDRLINNKNINKTDPNLKKKHSVSVVDNYQSRTRFLFQASPDVSLQSSLFQRKQDVSSPPGEKQDVYCLLRQNVAKRWGKKWWGRGWPSLKWEPETKNALNINANQKEDTRVFNSKIISFGNFDYIQYNESFKIYTTLAYTCLKTYEPHLSKYPNFKRPNQKKFQNSNRKVSFHRFQSLIEDWAALQKNNENWIFSTKYEKSYHQRRNAYPFLSSHDQLSTIFTSASKWRIMNNSNFNDAFIIIPCTLSLNVQQPSLNKTVYGPFSAQTATFFVYDHKQRMLYTSYNLTNLFYSFITPLQKVFYMNYIFQTTNEIMFLNRTNLFENSFVHASLEHGSKQTCNFFSAKKDIIKNKLNWSKTTNINNELKWLCSDSEKNTKRVADEFRLNSKLYEEENTYESKKLSFLVPKLKVTRFLKILAINFENFYYKNFLWNSRKITLRIVNNAVLPLVANRKYNISNFIAKKNSKATEFINMRMPRTFSFSSKFSTSFVWGFKQKTHPYLNVLNTNAENHKNFNNMVSKNNTTNHIRKHWLYQLSSSSQFSKIYNYQKPPFFSVRHKILGTTNFMCFETYPSFLDTSQTQNIFKPDFSMEVPLASEVENRFSNTDASPFYNDKTKMLNSKAYNLETHALSNFLQKDDAYLPYSGSTGSSNSSKTIKRDLTNEWQTQPPNDFFSQSFSSVRSKWKPFFMGSLRHFQPKDSSFGSPFLNLAIRRNKPNDYSENDLLSYNQMVNFKTSIEDSFTPTKLASFRKNRWINTLMQTAKVSNSENNSYKKTESKMKSSFINDLWSSSFFCRYSLYTISTKSDLFLQNLISFSGLTNQTINASLWPGDEQKNVETDDSKISSSTNEIDNPQTSIPFSSSQKRNAAVFWNSQNTAVSRTYIKNLHGSARTEKPFFKTKPSQSDQSNTDQFLNVKLASSSYDKTIQKILKSQNNKSTHDFFSNYDYYWQKAVHFAILRRFKKSKFNDKKKIRSNWSKNQPNDPFFLQYPKKNIDNVSQNSISVLKNKYSIGRLKNYERYFGNPLRRHINQNEFHGPETSIVFSTKLFNDLTTPKLKKANQHRIKSWKSIIWTSEADIYFCFRYPLFIQNCSLPWQKSKHVFCISKHWLNRITVYLKPEFNLKSWPQPYDTYLSTRAELPKTVNRNLVLNTSLLMTYTQLSSSSNKTHQPLLHSKLLKNSTLPVYIYIQNKGSYGMINYFTIKESLNSIYKVNYIVESQTSELKPMSEVAFHSNQNQKFIRPPNSMEGYHTIKRFENIQRNSITNDALTVSHFLNGTYSFIPSKTIILNSLNELMDSQINRSAIENENEYIQIDIWTNGELSPRQALLNAFRKLFELFYNLSKYNCLKPIEI